MPQPLPHNLALGTAGEQDAARFLQFKKFLIIDINYRTKFGEIDIIAQDKQELVFVEVRTRMSDEVLDPIESINLKKLGHIKLAAYSYLEEKNYSGDYRVDIVTILPKKITHFENVTM